MVSNWFRCQVNIHTTGQRVGDDQGWGGQVVGFHVGVDPGLKVPVTGQYRGDHQVVFNHGFPDVIRQWAAVADTGGTAVTHHVEPQLVQEGQQPGCFQVGSDHP